MDRKVRFLGFNFTLLQFILLLLGWTFFIAFIWPFIISSYLIISVFVCGLSLLIASVVTSKLLLGIIVMLLFSKRVVRFYINAMLILSALLGTWVYSWFLKMSTFIFIDHLVINTLTVFLYYRAFMEMIRDGEDDMGTLSNI